MAENGLKWYERSGNSAGVVCSTRVRLARNLQRQPFPARASLEQKTQVAQLAKAALLDGNSVLSREFHFLPMEELTSTAYPRRGRVPGGAAAGKPRVRQRPAGQGPVGFRR